MELDAVEHIKKRLKEGDTSCFTPLVNEYKDLVYALALKISRSTEDAEEISQDTFIKAFKNLNTFRGDSKLSTWLYQITYFTAINHIRKKKVETTDFEHLEAEADESIMDQIQKEDRSVFLQEAMGHLKPDERAVINLFYMEENSIEEVAKITRLTKANVKVKLHRSKKKLYGILSQIMKNELNSLV
ncbi:RNA polymerase sigma factor [Crocinitomix catalasitica]|nr:RNA polymerase sigma factor [Crocinitomix catalasitica]